MSLTTLHDQRRWPTREEVLNPPGAGPRFFVALVRRKIEAPLRRLSNSECRVGILTGHPGSNETEAPIAIVCEFPRAIPQEVLKEAHKLAWNFCRSPLLITVEPHLTRAWSCYETPDRDPDAQFGLEPVERLPMDDALATNAATALDWINLVSGQFFTNHADRFPENQRADRTLLENLKYVRKGLKKEIPEDIAHDLLARLVFIQFLFDRTDSAGKAALNESVLDKLFRNGTLSGRHRSLGELLTSQSDTYKFFHWLDERFNGDLFPGKGPAQPEQAGGWEREERIVKPRHLKLLSDFVSGQVAIGEGGQMSLWPLYCFDTIPLEFVSSIYEEFACGDEGKGEHYTPIALVDFMLDKVLPWHGDEWDRKVLDPACGSGIFLVRAFQRLTYRWRNGHPEQEPSAAFLRGILEQNLFGVDLNETAVRVASFSLYLAMCDEIDPKRYWEQVRFPRLRDVTLRHADFFREDVPGSQTVEDAGRYDLVIGNAPWGKKSLSEPARHWSADPAHPWETPNAQIGTLFLPKSAMLAKPTGQICLIQPAGSLLFNRNQPALDFRRKFFTNFKVEEVVNLSAIRFGVFKKAVGPACIVTFVPRPPDGGPLAYWSPKQHYSGRRKQFIILDDADLNWVYPHEAATDPWVWTALAWGGRRDYELIRRIKGDSRWKTLGEMISNTEGWDSTKGFERRIQNVAHLEDRLGLRILEEHRHWIEYKIVCIASSFPKNQNPYFGRPKNLKNFYLPKLILKLSWTVEQGRFRAALCEASGEDELLLFSQSFYGISAPIPSDLVSPAIVINSVFAVYFLFLTSARMGNNRPTALKDDIENIPIPFVQSPSIQDLSEMSLLDIDTKTYEFYGLKDSERILIEDFFEITLKDFKGSSSSPGRQGVLETEAGPHSVLGRYCETFITVLRATFGQDKPIAATIFASDPADPLPYRLVAIHLQSPGHDSVVRETLAGDELVKRLYALDHEAIKSKPDDGGVFYQRVARVYREETMGHGIVPTVYLIKPNQVRYWTRSAALRDADEVAADLFFWGDRPGGDQDQDKTHA